MIRARARDDGVPDDSLVGGVVAVGARGGPLGRDVDEDLLRVPREERRQVGFEGELEDSVLLLLVAIVVRASADDLNVLGREGARGRAVREDVGDGDEAGEDEGDGREEAEDGLDAGEAAVHDGELGDVSRSLSWSLFLASFRVKGGVVILLAHWCEGARACLLAGEEERGSGCARDELVVVVGLSICS